MNKSLANDALILTVSKVLTLVITMVTAMLLSRYLTVKEYGTYSQLLLIINLTTTIFMLGLPNSINFFLARAESNDDRQKFLSIYYTLSTILSVITGFVLMISTPLIVNYFDNLILKKFMYVLAILPWARIILSSIENVLVVYRKTSFLLLFRILNSLLLLIVILITMYLNLGFNIYMLLFLLVEALFALSIYIIVRNHTGKLKISFDKILIKKIFSFSIPIGLASVIGVLSVQLDKLIIAKFYSTEELAIYTNAAREMPVAIIATSLTAVMMPQLVRYLKNKRTEEAVTLWGDSISLAYIVICFSSIALFVFAPEVITILYSDKYLPGVTVFRIYSLALLLRFTYFGMILNSIGKTKIIFYSSLASLIINVILSYFFYRLIGFEGPAVATIISIALVQIIQLILTSKYIKVQFRRLFPWRKLGIITIINIIMGMFFYYLKINLYLEIHIGEVMESIFLGIGWGTLYLLITIKFIKSTWYSLSKIK